MQGVRYYLISNQGLFRIRRMVTIGSERRYESVVIDGEPAVFNSYEGDLARSLVRQLNAGEFTEGVDFSCSYDMEKRDIDTTNLTHVSNAELFGDQRPPENLSMCWKVVI